MSKKMRLITDDQIEAISKKYIRVCGDHWQNEMAIPEYYIDDFARDIEDLVIGQQEEDND